MRKCYLLLIAFVVLLSVGFVAGCSGGGSGSSTVSPEPSPSSIVNNSPVPQQPMTGTWEAQINRYAVSPALLSSGAYGEESGTYSDGNVTLVVVFPSTSFIYGKATNGVLFFGQGSESNGTLKDFYDTGIGSYTLSVGTNVCPVNYSIPTNMGSCTLQKTERNNYPLKGNYGTGNMYYNNKTIATLNFGIGNEGTIILYSVAPDNSSTGMIGKINDDDTFTITDGRITIISEPETIEHIRRGTWQYQ